MLFAVLYLLIVNIDLKRRVDAIEAAGLAGNSPPPRESAQPSDIPKPKAQPPEATVLNSQRFRELALWLAQNWFYAVSAVSLALAGVFLVIYGVENKWLSPGLRILIPMIFGCILIFAGEVIRRRYGDVGDTHAAYLPSVFSSAGIITLFGSVLAARLLYDFINLEVAFFGMSAVGILALVLGWFYGPLLAAIGIIGAMISPFIIGGSSDDPSALLIYFAIIVTVGLAIDTVHRWAWVSVISLLLGFLAGFLLLISNSLVNLPFIFYCTVLAVTAIAIPVRKFLPDHGGSLMINWALARSFSEPSPEFPTRLAGGAILAASVLIAFAALGSARIDLFWTAILATSGLVFALLIWARNAPALIDMVIFPIIAFLGIIATNESLWLKLLREATEAGASPPMTVSFLVAIGLMMSIVAAWRSIYGDGASRLFLALLAAVLAPLVLVTIEAFWQPAADISHFIWALHGLAVAVLMTAMAQQFAQRDGASQKDRVSFAVISALASIAFACVILFSAAALTLAIAVTVAAASLLDRQFNLPLMGFYLLTGTATIGYRLVIDPGTIWGINASLPDFLMAYAGSLAAFGAAYAFARLAQRPRSEILLESAVFSTLGLLLSVLLFRIAQSFAGAAGASTHWAVGVSAAIWIILGLAQLRRLEMGGTLENIRKALGYAFLAVAAYFVSYAVTEANPLLGRQSNLVIGPVLLNSLIPAYLLPAMVLSLSQWWIPSMEKALQRAMAVTGVLLAGLWLGLTIRHFWRGPEMMKWPGIDQPELYSYTVALLVIGAALFYRSLAAQNARLRLSGLCVIGLAVAKVFLLDIPNLDGLIRVLSLLCLGLVLAGLAWLNRWAIARGNSAQVAR